MASRTPQHIAPLLPLRKAAVGGSWVLWRARGHTRLPTPAGHWPPHASGWGERGPATTAQITGTSADKLRAQAQDAPPSTRAAVPHLPSGQPAAAPLAPARLQRAPQGRVRRTSATSLYCMGHSTSPHPHCSPSASARSPPRQGAAACTPPRCRTAPNRTCACGGCTGPLLSASKRWRPPPALSSGLQAEVSCIAR